MTSVLFEHDNFGHLFYEMICFFNEWSKWASLHMTQNFLIFSSTCFLNNFFLKKKIEGTMTIWLEMKEYNSASTTNGFSKHDNSWHSFNEVIFFFRGGGTCECLSSWHIIFFSSSRAITSFIEFVFINGKAFLFGEASYPLTFLVYLFFFTTSSHHF